MINDLYTFRFSSVLEYSTDVFLCFQELEDGKKEDDKDDMKLKTDKTGPDTDMLATLASAALEQDPKDKTVAGIKNQQFYYLYSNFV